MALYEIPLTPQNQKFNISLGGKQYKLQFIYRLDAWFFDVLDTSENMLISSLLICQGVNLLEQYQHILKGAFYSLNANKDESQAFSDLGRNIKLYWEPFE